MSTRADPVFEFAGITVRYPLDRETGRIGFQIVPSALKEKLATRRTTLRGERFIDVLPGDDPWPACQIESLAQAKILGDPYTGGFATGHTMRNSPSVDAFRFDCQNVHRDGEKTTVVTTLKSARGHRIEHQLSWTNPTSAIWGGMAV